MSNAQPIRSAAFACISTTLSIAKRCKAAKFASGLQKCRKLKYTPLRELLCSICLRHANLAQLAFLAALLHDLSTHRGNLAIDAKTDHVLGGASFVGDFK